MIHIYVPFRFWVDTYRHLMDQNKLPLLILPRDTWEFLLVIVLLWLSLYPRLFDRSCGLVEHSRATSYWCTVVNHWRIHRESNVKSLEGYIASPNRVNWRRDRYYGLSLCAVWRAYLHLSLPIDNCTTAEPIDEVDRLVLSHCRLSLYPYLPVLVPQQQVWGTRK